MKKQHISISLDSRKWKYFHGNFLYGAILFIFTIIATKHVWHIITDVQIFIDTVLVSITNDRSCQWEM